jgi:glycosyltransferase involved in cell wall biosynthesis
MNHRVHIVRGGFIHSLFWEQLRSCPEGFYYDLVAPTAALPNLKSDLRAPPQSRHRRLFRDAKAFVTRVRRWSTLPNVRFVRSTKHLVHSWQYPLITNAPWVIDFEDVGALVAYRPVSSRWYAPGLVKRLLSSRSCRALLPWTGKARESLVTELGPSLEPKTHVVYPAITPRADVTSLTPSASRRLLFIGSTFVTKGGVAAMRAFARVQRDVPDARLDMVTFLPEAYRAEAESVPGLAFHARAAPTVLDRLYREARALVAPFGVDTFGFVLLEAFAYGVPAVVSDNFALPELVGRGERGVVVPMSHSMFDKGGRRLYDSIPGAPDRAGGHPLLEAMANPPEIDIEQLASAMRMALTDDAWHASAARAALHSTSTGPFSHSERRRRLGEIYREAIRGRSEHSG